LADEGTGTRRKACLLNILAWVRNATIPENGKHKLLDEVKSISFADIDRIYLMGFNAGDNGPLYWHWIAGMGSPEALRYWVLSDARNEVKGKPKRVRTVLVGQRKRAAA
jgi:hypothetical protein